jgi:hypothetical protein
MAGGVKIWARCSHLCLHQKKSSTPCKKKHIPYTHTNHITDIDNIVSCLFAQNTSHCRLIYLFNIMKTSSAAVAVMKTSTTEESSMVNRIPPSTTKRRGSQSCSSLQRNRKRPKPEQPMEDVEDQFTKLNPTDPVHGKKIQQRKKALTKGKNTAGYDLYLQKVPKEKRRIRSMNTPSTPDPTLDIPNKRWQGMIRAWYVLWCLCWSPMFGLCAFTYSLLFS